MSAQPIQSTASTAIDRAIAALTYDYIEQIPLDGGPVLVNDQVPLLQRSIGADLVRIEATMSAIGKTLLSAIAASIDEAIAAMAEAKLALRLEEVGQSLNKAAEALAERKKCNGNLKPAPFSLNEKTVRDVFEGKPGRTCDLVPLSPEKLVDQPGPYCGPYPISKAAPKDGDNEPARVAPAKAEPSAPVEPTKLDRPDTSNDTSGTRPAPLSVTSTAPRSEEVLPAARESSRSGPTEGSVSLAASVAVRSLHSSTAAVEPRSAAETASTGPDTPGGPVARKADVQYRRAKDREARELERPVDRLDVIRAVAANLARREAIGQTARIPRAPIGDRRPAKAIKLPPLPSEMRRARIAAAIAFLKRECIVVDVCDRDAQIRRYRVSGKRESMLAEDVIQIAIDRGFEVQA